MNTLLPVLIAMTFFGVVHSLTAALNLKAWARRVMGERLYHGLYRLLYNILSVVTLVPALVAMVGLPDQTLYVISFPLSGLAVIVQLVGVVGVVASLLATDLFKFVGLTQFLMLLSGGALPLPDRPLVTTGVYRLVRHPLYFFSLLALWPLPIMTRNVLLFNLAATAYFILGSYPEERKLEAVFGEAYRQYKAKTPRLIPLPRLQAR